MLNLIHSKCTQPSGHPHPCVAWCTCHSHPWAQALMTLPPRSYLLLSPGEQGRHMDRESGTVTCALKDIMCMLQENSRCRAWQGTGRRMAFILHRCLHIGKGNGSKGGNHKERPHINASAGVSANFCPIRISWAWEAGSESYGNAIALILPLVSAPTRESPGRLSSHL